MITEKQKHLIFDINCFYQLESQNENISNGQPIEMLPELGFVAMKASSDEQKINWLAKQNEITEKLKQYGFSENWLLKLKTSLNNQLNSGHSPEDFRIKFLTPIDLLVNMVMSIIMNADPSIPKQQIAEHVINDIFEKDYWEGPVVQQINTVRTLSTSLGLDKYFVIEFGKILVSQ